MGSKKRIEVIILKPTLKGLEPNFLQDNIAKGIGEDFLFNSKLIPITRVLQLIERNARPVMVNFKRAIPLFLRKEAAAIGDNEFLITRASLVHSRKVNLIQSAMAHGEPDTGMQSHRRANPDLGARSPTWWNSGPPRSKTL